MGTNFDKCLAKILEHEGGYSSSKNNPNDRGGDTNFGITQRTYDKYRTNSKLKLQPVKNISMQEIDKIYYNDYWKPAKCDILPEKIDCLIFDIAVNSGVKAAIQTLQRSLAVLDDGIFGEISLKALNAKDYNILYKDIIKDRIQQYCNIVIRDNSQLTFLKGWMKRITSYI